MQRYDTNIKNQITKLSLYYLKDVQTHQIKWYLYDSLLMYPLFFSVQNKIPTKDDNIYSVRDCVYQGIQEMESMSGFQP